MQTSLPDGGTGAARQEGPWCEPCLDPEIGPSAPDQRARSSSVTYREKSRLVPPPEMKGPFEVRGVYSFTSS